MFWILWFFIAFIIVLVAFTLRKENEEMPRREILRAVESTGKMGFAERSFLWVFSWLDTRFRILNLVSSQENTHKKERSAKPILPVDSTARKISLRGISSFSLRNVKATKTMMKAIKNQRIQNIVVIFSPQSQYVYQSR